MRQLQLPFYEPSFPAPERAVLTLLHAALSVTERAVSDAHPLVGSAVGEPEREPDEDVMHCVARLLIGRCSDLRELIDLYDAMVDRLHAVDLDTIPF